MRELNVYKQRTLKECLHCYGHVVLILINSLQEKDDDGNIMYRIEVPANRTDLLSVEGIGRALKVFTGTSSPPNFVLSPPQPNPANKMTVKASVGPIL